MKIGSIVLGVLTGAVLEVLSYCLLAFVSLWLRDEPELVIGPLRAVHLITHLVGAPFVAGLVSARIAQQRFLLHGAIVGAIYAGFWAYVSSHLNEGGGTASYLGALPILAMSVCGAFVIQRKRVASAL